MRGVVFLGNRQVEIREFPDPQPGPGEAVREDEASGLCGSDLRPYRGDEARATISGHEPCGVVGGARAGVTAGPALGDRVIVHHYSGCGSCKHCRIGYTQLCIRVATTSTASARTAATPTIILVPASDAGAACRRQLSFEAGAAVACGTGTAYMALKRLDVSGRDTLAIFGQGPVGLSATMLGAAMGARVIAVDVTPSASTSPARGRRRRRSTRPRTTRCGRSATSPTARARTPRWTAPATRRPRSGGAAARVWGRVCLVGEGGTVTLTSAETSSTSS